MTDLHEANCASEASYLIFITGIPSKTTSAVVLDHFKQYGGVSIYRLQQCAKGQRVLHNHASANIKRGFCILQAPCEATYKKILASREPFFGRSLAIGPFRQGSALWNHNEHVSSRRVIVKKVPSLVSEDALRLALETEIGPIKRMYRFAAESSEKAAKKEKNRKTNTYSVEFFQDTSADKAAQFGALYLNGSYTPLIIEKYQKKVTPVRDLTHQPTHPTNNSTHRSSRQTKPVNKKSGSLVTADHQQSQLPQNLLPPTEAAEFHELRPTNKQYHVDRETIPSYSLENNSFNYRVRRAGKAASPALNSGVVQTPSTGIQYSQLRYYSNF